MNSALETILGLGVLIAIVALPQLPGLLILLRSRRRHFSTVLRATLVLGPAVFFFIGSRAFFGNAAEQIRARGEYVCGMFGLFGFMAESTILWGTVLQLILGAGLQALHVVLLLRVRAQPLANTS